MKRLAVVLLLLLVFAACRRTETTTETASTETATTVDTAATATETAAATDTTTTVPAGDLEFATTASMANLYEITAGLFAGTKATGAAYKKFAMTMAAQHTEIGDSYKPIAETQHLPMPTELSGEFQTLYAALQAAPAGAAYNALYKLQMIQTHTSAVQLFRTEAETGQDPELKAFAAKWLPTIEHHLEMAKALPS